MSPQLTDRQIGSCLSVCECVNKVCVSPQGRQLRHFTGTHLKTHTSTQSCKVLVLLLLFTNLEESATKQQFISGPAS